MARIAKVCIGWLCSVFGLYGLVLGGRSLVVALHRVAPGTQSDAMTLPADLFESFCRFFKKHFRVVPLAEIVGKLERKEGFDREVALTFDDGYEDACTVAMPIMRAHGLTATVFLVSGFVGTSTVPWWDERDGVHHRFMDWDQVRAMRAAGFDIGSHTRTHPDMGSIGGDQARDELTTSRAELEAGLGQGVDLFAYPYGYDQYMSDGNRLLVAEAGYRCCCCYGDFVEPGDDPMRLGRLPVSAWYSSAAHLGGDLAVRALRKRLALWRGR